MNAELIVTLLTERGAQLSREDAERIFQRNTRFLPERSREDYHSIVLLEASETPAHELDAKTFENICNRVSKRLLYAAKVRSERFVEIGALTHEPSVPPENSLAVKEILQQLPLEEQIYLVMRMEGYTLGEIAERFQLPISTAHQTWNRIAAHARKLFKEDVS